MEALEMTLFGDIYRGRRVLLTGHTGFKGSWLALWLSELGAHVIGVSLDPPTAPNHWDLLHLRMDDHRLDIHDAVGLTRLFAQVRPDIIFHLAAQPLVRHSYRDPIATWSTNVMGTANVLEACRSNTGVRAIVAVTTDKCYENRGWVRGYRETDTLGGSDPYSASKAGAELVAVSYRAAFFSEPDTPLLATARAGNVIGGGDWAEERLIPDLVRAIGTEASLAVRHPEATRPWQHVLECLAGYLLLGQQLLVGKRQFADAWNFGPADDDNCTVGRLLDRLGRHWPDVRWHKGGDPGLHEAMLLYLDAAKARKFLHWRPVWTLDEGLAATASWYRRFLASGQPHSRTDLEDYVAAARMRNAAWAA